MSRYVPIKQHPDYEINKNGHIRRSSTKKMLKQTIDENGYLTVSINGETMYVHRLVAVQFLKPLAEKTEVDHINHDRSDNRLINLRWSNRSENNKNKIQSLDPMNNIQITKYGTYRTRNKSGLKTFKTVQEAILFRNTQVSI
jgi:hypothetical protein